MYLNSGFIPFCSFLRCKKSECETVLFAIMFYNPNLVESNEFSGYIFQTVKTKHLFWKHLLLLIKFLFQRYYMHVQYGFTQFRESFNRQMNLRASESACDVPNFEYLAAKPLQQNIMHTVCQTEHACC
jgi:hypothetical protein